MKQHDYIKLAEAIKENSGETDNDGQWVTPLEYIVKDSFLVALCSILKADNKKFDEAKFRSLLK
jgi:hypothetical protein